MSAQRNTFVLWKQVQPVLSYLPPMGILAAVAVLCFGAGMIFFMPVSASNTEPAAGGPRPAAATQANADESSCDKQAWPYVDQRCARKVDAARGMRQVRIVTDKGHSVTTMTPQPVVQEKPKPAPAVATNDRPMGPPVAAVVNNPAPQPEKITSALSQPAPAPQKPAAWPAPPAVASAAPAEPGVDAFAQSRPKKSKSARAAEKAAEKAAKREAMRAKRLEQDDPNGQAEVVGSVKPQPAETRSSRRARNAVPDEVIAAVERAVARERSRGGGQMATADPEEGGGGRRIFVVPREERF